jgi:hypothetical protein
MVAEFQNKDFSVSGGGPGEAEDWTLTAFMQLPGWAKFRTYLGVSLSEHFDWFDSYAQWWSGLDTFSIQSFPNFTVAAVGMAPLNYFEIPGDSRRILPITGCVKVSGTVPGQTNLNAYWTISSVEFDGTNTRIYVTEDILADVPANLLIPPIVYLNIDNYGWGARSESGATFPVGPFGGGETLDLSIQRNTPITITFAGGETTAQDVVDRMNLQFAALGVSGEVVAVVEGGVPVIKTLLQASGRYIQITGGTANTTLLFSTLEQYGFGQFAQIFDIYVDTLANVTSGELVDIFKEYTQHGYFRAREAEHGGRLLVRSEKAGELATCQVWGYNGDVMSNATWPIAARTGANNELDITIGSTSFTVFMTEGATTADELREDIRLAIQSAGVSGSIDIAGNGQLVIGGARDVWITGGSANADLAFPTHRVWGNNHTHGQIGFTSAISVGVYDVGFAESFDDVDSVAANFAGGSAIETSFETFEWDYILADLDEATILDAGFKSWAEKWFSKPITEVGVSTLNRFKTSGQVAEYFFDDSSLLVQGSPGNDGRYTVASTTESAGSTYIYVDQDVLDPTVGGRLYPMFFNSPADDFDQAWETSFLSNPNDPPHRFWDGVLVGNQVTFPLNIPSNRNEMWIYVGSEENLVHIVIDPDVYDTAAELVANMNAKFSAASGADLQFSVHEESDDETSAKVGFGWDGLGGVTEEFYFVNQHGTYEGLDIRNTIGLIRLGAPTVSRIKVPSRYFDKIEGSIHSTAPELWQGDARMFDVDPDSRFSYTIQSTPAAETMVVPEGQDFALFNQVAAPDNSANEALIPEGWGGAILDETAFEALLTVAWFDQTPPLTPQQFEDFEEGW